MRVGLLTSYTLPEDRETAWATLPLMRQYCRLRGYTLAVGQGMSPEGMFQRFGDQFETAMLFVPINFIITDPSVRFENLGYRQEEAPFGLGCRAWKIEDVRHLAAGFPR